MKAEQQDPPRVLLVFTCNANNFNILENTHDFDHNLKSVRTLKKSFNLNVIELNNPNRTLAVIPLGRCYSA